MKSLATSISSIELARPIRVAVDGRTASGKTTLADELAEQLIAVGRDVIRTSIDGFHRPKAERYARGRHSPEGYYYDARDLDAINALLLSPLGAGGNHEYRTASFDLLNDQAIKQAARIASSDAILIVDGTFLQRPELVENWDLVIFVETTEATSAQRGVGRDTQLLGGIEAARQLYAARYQPAYRLYETICAPATSADVVFNNEDVDRPVLTVRGNGRLPA
ncbi:uridylate kinase [Neorhizobium sp. P12A]|uniref:uridylate kinase n=1 Tax=Neorhizobium sp. P12A TaxID=2268027 RepID=UPI001FED54B9|nr:uridylate kinase [Neorhizobium sp. P12A]